MSNYEPADPLPGSTSRRASESWSWLVRSTTRQPVGSRLDMPRLHVHKIVSIGAVESGDNPEAEILFWKAAPEVVKATDTSERRRARSTLRALQIRIQRVRPLMTLADAKAEAARLRPDLVKLLVAKVLKSQGKRIAEVEETTATLLRQIEDDERKPPMTRKPADIFGEVDALADELIAKGDADNLVEARAKVWHDRPDLVKKSRTQTRYVVGNVLDQTLAEEITTAVHKVGLEMTALPGEWNTPIPELNVRAWHLPGGQKLRQLMLAARQSKPDVIRKSGEHAEAFRILKAWTENPREVVR